MIYQINIFNKPKSNSPVHSKHVLKFKTTDSKCVLTLNLMKSEYQNMKKMNSTTL